MMLPVRVIVMVSSGRPGRLKAKDCCLLTANFGPLLAQMTCPARCELSAGLLAPLHTEGDNLVVTRKASAIVSGTYTVRSRRQNGPEAR